MKILMGSIAFFILIEFSPTLAQSLSVDFYLDKKEFLYGEPLAGIVLLKNKGNDINIPQFGFMYDFSGLGAELFNENNESLNKNRDMTLHYDLTYKQLLRNDESICDFLDICYEFGIADDKLSSSKVSFSGRALPVGKYKLIITYQNAVGKNEHYQQELEFNVIQPKTQIDIELFNALSEAISNFNSTNNEDSYYADLKSIIDNQSISDYKLLAYLRVIFQLYLNDSTANASTYLDKMFKEYPNKVATYMISSLFWDSDKNFFHKPEIQTIIKNSTCFDYLYYYLNSYKLITN